jgi:hypothetical protein
MRLPVGHAKEHEVDVVQEKELVLQHCDFIRHVCKTKRGSGGGTGFAALRLHPTCLHDNMK